MRGMVDSRKHEVEGNLQMRRKKQKGRDNNWKCSIWSGLLCYLGYDSGILVAEWYGMSMDWSEDWLCELRRVALAF